MYFELSTMIVWISLLIVNTNSKFQESIFSNNRDITKCPSFSKSKKGHNSERKKKNAFLIIPLDSMDCSFG